MFLNVGLHTVICSRSHLEPINLHDRATELFNVFYCIHCENRLQSYVIRDVMLHSVRNLRLGGLQPCFSS